MESVKHLIPILSLLLFLLLFSIEYWFRVLDKDGDGFLSLYELEYFYEDILLRLEEMNIESLSVRDTICHVLDMINPKHQCKYMYMYTCTYMY